MTEKRKWEDGDVTEHAVTYSTHISCKDILLTVYTTASGDDDDLISTLNAGEAHPALVEAARAVCDKARECEIASHHASYMDVQDSLCDELNARFDALRALLLAVTP